MTTVLHECYQAIRNHFFPRPRKYESPLVFSPLAWIKINCYINLVGNLEVTGLGKIEGNTIVDVTLLPQEATGSTVECPEEAIAQFIMDKGAEAPLWQLDWHSHPSFSTTPSGTDWTNYAVMQAIRMGESFPFLIINKSQDITAGEYMGSSTLNKIDIEIPDGLPPEIEERHLKFIYDICKKDILEHCKQKTYNYPSYGNTGFGVAQSYNKTTPYNRHSIYNKEETSIIKPWSRKDETPRFRAHAMEAQYCKACGDELSIQEESNVDGMCDNCIEEVKALADYTGAATCGKCGNILTLDEEANGFCDECLLEATDTDVLQYQ